MRAMTWWDHETRSIWSQPWGRAIEGPLKGTRLEMIPARIMPWKAWLEDYPRTLLLDTSTWVFQAPGALFNDKTIIGVTLGEFAKAYPLGPAGRAGVINDWVGPFPVVVFADEVSKAVYVYSRQLGDRELEFSLSDGRPVDRQTGSTWDIVRGIALDGPLRGEVLRQVPYMSAYRWAWEDFYPHSKFYGESP